MKISTSRYVIAILALLPSYVCAGFVPAYTIINDDQDFSVRSNGGYVQHHTREIRIDTPQGVDAYGQAKIFYDEKRDKLEVITAYTIKPNGERIYVSPDGIKRQNAYTEDIAPYFSDQMVATIIFPQVEVGSALHYESVLIEAEPVIAKRFSDITPFTPHRPYTRARLVLTHPKDIDISAYSRGVEATKTLNPDGTVRHEFLYEQSATYPTEPGQILYEDFSPVIQLSNYKDYGDLAKVTYDLFAPKTKVTRNVQKLADEITAGAKTQREKAIRAYNWVSKNIRYVGIDVGASGFEPHFADEILANRYGDCKDHAVILESLLLAVGIESSPVLINTESSYRLPELAGNYYFDHIITYIPEFNLYVDSTAQFAEFGTLPSTDMGKPTLIVAQGKLHATPNTKVSNDRTVTTTWLKLLPDGSIVGNSKYEPYGYFITNSRMYQFTNENRDTQSVVDSILLRNRETGSGELFHGDPRDLSHTWVVKSEFTLDPIINMPGPSALSIPTGIAPGFIKAFSRIRPYKNRRFPYECGSSKHTEFTYLELPPGTSIQRLPEDKTVVMNGLVYKSSYKLQGRQLSSTRSLSVSTKADVCSPNMEYQSELATFMQNVKKDLRQQIYIE